MVKEKYIRLIQNTIYKHDTHSAEKKWFIFGSSLEKKRFGDIDIGVLATVDNNTLGRIQEELYESTLPYKVDIVDFTKVTDEFKNFVFHNRVVWI